MDAPRITTTIITLNEEKSLPKALESVSWTDEIVVVDSGSTDQTTEIAKKFGAKVFFNRWPGSGAQKNFAQSKASNDWVLNIDADEVVPKNLAKEIRRQLAQNGREYLGYEIPRKTFYLGRWIRHGGWYPNYLIRLAHRKHSKWTEPQVHESLSLIHISEPTRPC